MTAPPPTPTAYPLTRRAVIRQAGLAAAALAGLSACTSYGAGSSGSSSAPASAAPAGGASSGSGGRSAGATVKTADIPVGGGKVFPDISAVVTQPKAGRFKAFSSICTHAQCPVADVTDTINCNCHGSRFSITDGSVLNPPASQPLPARTVTVKGDDLTVS